MSKRSWLAKYHLRHTNKKVLEVNSKLVRKRLLASASNTEQRFKSKHTGNSYELVHQHITDMKHTCTHNEIPDNHYNYHESARELMLKVKNFLSIMLQTQVLAPQARPNPIVESRLLLSSPRQNPSLITT